MGKFEKPTEVYFKPSDSCKKKLKINLINFTVKLHSDAKDTQLSLQRKGCKDLIYVILTYL